MSFTPRDISLLEELRRLRHAEPLPKETLAYLADVRKQEQQERTREILQRRVGRAVVTSSNRLNGVEVWARQFFDLKEDDKVTFGGERSVVRNFPQKVLQCVDTLKGGGTVQDKVRAVFMCNPEQNMTKSLLAEVLGENKDTIESALSRLTQDGVLAINQQPICMAEEVTPWTGPPLAGTAEAEYEAEHPSPKRLIPEEKTCSPKILGETAYYMPRHLREAAGVPKETGVPELLTEWWTRPLR